MIGEIYEFSIDVEIYKQCLTNVNRQFLFLRFSDAQLGIFNSKSNKNTYSPLCINSTVIQFVKFKWDKKESQPIEEPLDSSNSTFYTD